MSKTPDERMKDKRALIVAYKNVFKGRDAELVLDDLRKRFYYDYPAYTKGDTARDGDIKEGMRIAFLHIKGRINYNLENLKLNLEDE